ncbi:MAG: tRNA (adenosine(37)-N6)-threonylcarbamoyltransferase complex dimerization subunit type 1 TsaB [bacterium]
MMEEQIKSVENYSLRFACIGGQFSTENRGTETLKAQHEISGRILAIDTSSRTGVVVLADLSSGQFQSVTISPGLTHGRELVPTIQNLFKHSGMKFRQLDAVAIGIGPGSYTGLRVGMAVAKTIAEVIDKPCLAIDSLLLPVLNLPDSEKIAISIADAQRGAIYLARYLRQSPDTAWACTHPPQILPWDELRNWASVSSAIITGPGLALSAKLGPPEARTADEANWLPDHVAMQKLVSDYLNACPAIDRHTIEPLYIRPSAAEEKRQELTAASDQAPFQA